MPQWNRNQRKLFHSSCDLSLKVWTGSPTRQKTSIDSHVNNFSNSSINQPTTTKLLSRNSSSRSHYSNISKQFNINKTNKLFYDSKLKMKNLKKGKNVYVQHSLLKGPSALILTRWPLSGRTVKSLNRINWCLCLENFCLVVLERPSQESTLIFVCRHLLVRRPLHQALVLTAHKRRVQRSSFLVRILRPLLCVAPIL